MNLIVEDAGGYRMRQESIKILCHPDDAILMAHNKDDLQRLLYRFQVKAESFNMQISMEKTESMVVAEESIRYKFTVNDECIRQRMQYMYLGIDKLQKFTAGR
ncbi:hypothetical protein Trydic_g23794 [Trypoxylus dichotomus]